MIIKKKVLTEIIKEIDVSKWKKNTNKYFFVSFLINTNKKKTVTTFYFFTYPKKILYIYKIKNFEKLLEKNTNLIELKNIKSFFENKNILKITYNLQNYYKIFKKFHIKMSKNILDINLELYITKGLIQEKIIKEKINYEYKQYEKNFFKSNKNRSKIKQEDLINKMHKIIIYIHLKCNKILNKEKKLNIILNYIDLPLSALIYKIENYGFLLDCKKLKIQSKNISQKMIILEKASFLLAGEKFNMLSSKQTEYILFQKKNFKKFYKTPGGKNSTKELVLLKLSEKNLLPKIILQYRSLCKLKSSYIDKLPKMINKKTKRIHTSYNQCFTITGRLSSSNPNLQNIPKHSVEGNKIRQSFIAPSDSVILTADYSQIELRILAHLSKDNILMKSFKKHKDIHTSTASEIFEIPINQITDHQRQIAKTINFSLIYGMTAFGLSKKLKINIIKAKKCIDNYFKKYEGICRYIKKIHLQAIKKGYVSTLFGRKIYIKNINSKNYNLKRTAYRQCMNAPMQGTVSDIIKKSMIIIDKYIKNKYQKKAKIILQIHDELIFEIKKESVKILCKKIQKIMETIIVLDIPIPVNIKIGDNWSETYELKKYFKNYETNFVN